MGTEICRRAPRRAGTEQQRTEIRQTVLTSAPRVNNVNFSISVGTVVPRVYFGHPL